VISLFNVQKIFPPDQKALQDITLKIPLGGFLFIAGASGAGKSTLLKLIFGEERSSSGEIIVGGRNLEQLKGSELSYLRRNIGVIFQDYKLLPRKTVLDNVGFTLEVQGVGEIERRKQVHAILEFLDLEGKADSYPERLSGGEQQRVSIARALIHKPPIILADEPTGNLDIDMTNTVFDLLLEANAAGVTVIVATHNLSIIEELDIRTVVLDCGKIIGDFKNPRKGV
jgi:cell division transport system ATP-binding protein